MFSPYFSLAYSEISRCSAVAFFFLVIDKRKGVLAIILFISRKVQICRSSNGNALSSGGKLFGFLIALKNTDLDVRESECSQCTVNPCYKEVVRTWELVVKNISI